METPRATTTRIKVPLNIVTVVPRHFSLDYSVGSSGCENSLCDYKRAEIESVGAMLFSPNRA